MELKWKIPGEWYHDNKKEFKRLRDEYGKLTYLGFAQMAWQSPDERVSLIAERYLDENGDEKTKEVTIIWEGKDTTWLLEELKELFSQFVVDEVLDELMRFDLGVQAEINAMLSNIYRPPDAFINQHIKAKLKERKELISKFQVNKIDDGFKGRMPVKEIFKEG